jgi:hypothetical protein
LCCEPPTVSGVCSASPLLRKHPSTPPTPFSLVLRSLLHSQPKTNSFVFGSSPRPCIALLPPVQLSSPKMPEKCPVHTRVITSPHGREVTAGLNGSVARTRDMGRQGRHQRSEIDSQQRGGAQWCVPTLPPPALTYPCPPSSASMPVKQPGSHQRTIPDWGFNALL